MTSRRFARLPLPSVLFSDNHLLVMNKPAGWMSIPADSNFNRHKSLLEHLKQTRQGGGSQKDYLLPIHRIDQPCSGVVMYAKTSKAASRITKLWKQEHVQKSYLCVLDMRADSLKLLRHASQEEASNWWNLEGRMVRSKGHKSTIIHPVHTKGPNMRQVGIRWKLLNKKKGLLEVTTSIGARHMVRALLSQRGQIPLAGDLRYGASPPLPDQSVALHAYRVSLPDSLQLGSTKQRRFTAPIPELWDEFFGITQKEIDKQRSKF